MSNHSTGSSSTCGDPVMFIMLSGKEKIQGNWYAIGKKYLSIKVIIKVLLKPFALSFIAEKWWISLTIAISAALTFIPLLGYLCYLIYGKIKAEGNNLEKILLPPVNNKNLNYAFHDLN